MTQQQKSYMMPLAMITGGLLHNVFTPLNFITPYLIFIMLFVTYCRISLKDMKPNKLHLSLISFQLIASMAVYFLVNLYDTSAAQGAMVCVLAPTATAAVVIAVMLGAGVANMATYSLIVNLVMAIAIPLALSIVGANGDITFWGSVITIGKKVFPLLMMPLFTAMALKKVWNTAYLAIQKRQSISFYLWMVALTIVTARTISFILEQPASSIKLEIVIALIALVICILQFVLGRYIGRRNGDVAAGGQSLGQKNTILAIWLCQSFLNPISSIAPASYVLWQNLVNSFQLWIYKGESK